MAKIPNGILGGVSGKIGGVIGSSWKGINVVKTRPLSVANPNTVPQQTQRKKFTGVTKFASDILSDFVKPYWDRFAVKASGYNDFVRENVNCFVNAELSDPASLKISNGKMSADELTIKPINDGGEDLQIEWAIKPQPKFKAGNDLADQVGVIAPGEIIGIGDGLSVRDDLETTITLNRPVHTGEIIHVYLVNRRPDGTITSQTAYASVTVG